jgi:hypothetical protein
MSRNTLAHIPLSKSLKCHIKTSFLFLITWNFVEHVY